LDFDLFNSLSSSLLEESEDELEELESSDLRLECCKVMQDQDLFGFYIPKE
jgi:hypothetical protein